MNEVEAIKMYISRQCLDPQIPIEELLYQCYKSRATLCDDVIRENFTILEQCTQELPFEQSDRICTAAIAIAAESERLAFEDGFSIGAKLILDLIGKQ